MYRVSKSKQISYFVECLVVNALVADVIVARQQRVNKELDAAQVVAGYQFTPGRDHVLGNGVERYVDRIASRLISAAVNVKVQVADRFEHAVAEQKDRPSVRVNCVDELGIGGIQTDVIGHVLEVRLSGIEACDPTKSRDSFTCVTASVSSKGMAHQVDIGCINSEMLLLSPYIIMSFETK